MIELEYFFEGKNGQVDVYQLIRFAADEPWQVVLDGELLGSLENLHGRWRQINGGQLSGTLFNDLTRHIADQYFNRLPQEILSRWPKLIQEVILKSDQAYLIVCKQGIHFGSFERIFTRFIPVMLKDEWPVSFEVFNHDFSADFSIVVTPEKRHLPPAYQSWNT